MAAIVYDAFLLAAVLFVATAVILPLNSGSAFTSKQYYYPIYLIGVSFFFYAWFWTHGGQTLGLRTWKTKILTFDKRPITWRQAVVRFVAAILSWACLGIGFWWIGLNNQKYGWHDILSGTAVFFESEANPE